MHIIHKLFLQSNFIKIKYSSFHLPITLFLLLISPFIANTQLSKINEIEVTYPDLKKLNLKVLIPTNKSKIVGTEWLGLVGYEFAQAIKDNITLMSKRLFTSSEWIPNFSEVKSENYYLIPIIFNLTTGNPNLSNELIKTTIYSSWILLSDTKDTLLFLPSIIGNGISELGTFKLKANAKKRIAEAMQEVFVKSYELLNKEIPNAIKWHKINNAIFNNDTLQILSNFDINEKDKNGNSLLSLACIHNNFHVTQFLINQQIHIDNVNNFGCTPLMIASSKGNSDIVNILLKNNAKTEIQLPDGSNAAIIAEVFKYPNIAENINFAAKTNHHIEKMSTNDIEKLIKTTFTAADFIDLFENIFIPDDALSQSSSDFEIGLKDKVSVNSPSFKFIKEGNKIIYSDKSITFKSIFYPILGKPQLLNSYFDPIKFTNSKIIKINSINKLVVEEEFTKGFVRGFISEHSPKASDKIFNKLYIRKGSLIPYILGDKIIYDDPIHINTQLKSSKIEDKDFILKRINTNNTKLLLVSINGFTLDNANKFELTKFDEIHFEKTKYVKNEDENWEKIYNFPINSLKIY